MNARACIRSPFFVVTALLIVSGVVIGILGRTPDLSGAPHPIDDIQLPPQAIAANLYLDGGNFLVGGKLHYFEGSADVRITDQSGTVFEFALPLAIDPEDPYPSVFHGATTVRSEGAVEIGDSIQAKRALLKLLHRYADRGDEDTMHAYFAIRGKEAITERVRMFIKSSIESP